MKINKRRSIVTNPSRLILFILGLSLGLGVRTHSSWAVVTVTNGGFEAGSSGTATGWTAFSIDSATSERRDNGTDSTTTDIPFGLVPRTGTYAWYANASGTSSGGAFQNIFGVRPGDSVSFSGFIQSANVNSPAFGNIRIEFMNNTATVLQTNSSASVGSSSSYTSVSASGVAPAATTFARLTFSSNLNPNGSGDWVFDDLSASHTPGNIPFPDNYSFPVSLSSGLSTGTHMGDLVTVSTKIRNATSVTIPNVELVIEVPAGFTLVPDSVIQIGKGKLLQQAGEGSIFAVGDISSGSSVDVIFQVAVTSGVVPRHNYEIKVYARSGVTLGQISAVDSLNIRLKNDPLFEEGTVLGKVFDDRDEDGMQSKGEIGVPRVRIYTEYGVSVVTDKDGRFHIPAVQPGRHVLKIDGHTLPQGTKFVTEESLLIKTTPGLLNKVRFAVRLPESALPEEFRKELQLWVTQGIDLTRPELKISLEPDILKVGLGRLEREPIFRIKTNYGDYVTRWQIEIRNEMGEKVWTGFGLGQPPAQVPWNGVTDAGELIRPGVYACRLVVRDNKDRQDWTPLQFFRVARKIDIFKEGGDVKFELPSTGAFNVSRDGKRSIPLVAVPTVRVYGKTKPNRRVSINGVPAEVNRDGEFEQEMFVRPGRKTLSASATDSQGDTVTVEEKIEVKNSSFFMVALGEEEMGGNLMKGNQETVARDDTFHEGFYEKGQLSYYLKSKIRGKFLVKSRYATGDKQSELFTHLDPDDYYPVYGDYSQIEYEGQDTRERLFVLVEMDRSFLKWGSYQTNFSDTELGRYNRTLSGLKVHFESLSSTKYGDSRRGFGVFWSKPNTLADHNEFRATGGSLYYLHNRNVIQGGEKVRVEVRDKIQDIPINSRDLIAGQDYEIDQRQGRILLKKPLSSVAASETIISNDILDGNPVFLIVDYEFETNKIFEDKSAGLRGYTHMGDHVRVGGTAVEEKRANVDYDLRTVDALVRLGRNTKLQMEYGQAKLQQVRQAISFDGGLSFRNQTPIQARHRPPAEAVLIKAESKPVKPLEVSGYFQDVEPGFSIDRIRSQEGFQKHGVYARWKFNEHFHLLGRQDSTEVVARLRPLAQFSNSFEFEKLHSTTGQAVFDYGKWNVTGEYLHQTIDVLLQNRLDSFFSETPFRNAVGLKIAHRVLDWFTPYLKSQYAFYGKNNFQVGGGLEARLGNRSKIFFEEMLGRVGDATLLGVSVQQDDQTTSYATIKSRDLGFGTRKVSTSVGTSHQLTERSRVYSEREYSSYSGSLPLSLTPTFVGEPPTPGISNSDIYGYETRFGKGWDAGLRFERRHLDAGQFRLLTDRAIDDQIRTNTFNTLSGSLGYRDSKRFKMDESLEVRFEPTAPKIQQWVTQNSAEWKINQDLSFLGKTNFGTSRFIEPGGLTGRFIELNAGLAYRPVESDRLNWLARYTYLQDLASDAQFVGSDSGSIAADEQAQIVAIEGGYDLSRSFQIVDKLAYRMGRFRNAVSDWVGLNTFLWIQRFNYHVTRKWDLGMEYRMLFQREAIDTFRHGPLVELDRELYDYVRLGIGYNFTDFSDDLRKTNDFTKNGFFVRLSGKI